jgi:molybdenum cofactor cytidylyltransferase
VNIRATGPGVVALDAAAIARAQRGRSDDHAGHGAEWQRVVAGTMVGTVKIISYAVDGVALEAACAAGAGALRRVAPVARTAALIVTEAPDGPRGATRRGSPR